VGALSSCGGGLASSDDDAEPTGAGGEAALTLEDQALLAISEDAAVAERAIAALREAGPRGHAALIARHGWTLEVLRQSPPATLDPSHERLRHAMDVVSGQRDGHASGLYWHTDLEAAQREARETGRPILSLRMLGRLDEEMSCANSRYFRVVLYANHALSSYLREHYVLHWSSERPVPRITIDMGDGRRLERTITGNSIHYVLDADGRVIDAMPGLLGPREMQAFLSEAEHAHLASRGSLEDAELGTGEAAIARHLARTGARERSALLAARRAFPSIPDPLAAANGPAPEAPSALIAMPLTVSKLAVEGAMVDAMRAPDVDPVEVGPVDWARVGLEVFRLEAGGIFDAQSLALLRLKTGRDEASERALVEALSRTVVGDTARNRATFRQTLLAWLSAARPEGEARPTLADFNERVYRDLFLTPASDPWLGLQDPTVWDAIERLH
jgi:hypothetical protein